MAYITLPKFVTLFLASMALTPIVSADWMTDWCSGFNFVNDSNFLLMFCQNMDPTSTFPILVTTNPGNCIGNSNGTMERGSGYHLSCPSLQWSLNSYDHEDDQIYIDPTIVGVCRTAEAKKRLSQIHVNDVLFYDPFKYLIRCV